MLHKELTLAITINLQMISISYELPAFAYGDTLVYIVVL